MPICLNLVGIERERVIQAILPKGILSQLPPCFEDCAWKQEQFNCRHIESSPKVRHHAPFRLRFKRSTASSFDFTVEVRKTLLLYHIWKYKARSSDGIYLGLVFYRKTDWCNYSKRLKDPDNLHSIRITLRIEEYCGVKVHQY